jgi:hypothetical protein
MTDEEKALMRKRYMKCYVELLLLPDEVLREEFPHLFTVPDAGLAGPLIPRNAAKPAESSPIGTESKIERHRNPIPGP